ncbi:MAG: hypothetical protein HOY78_02360 [Saccharothrix sp.]|nr:hypothetical protein [Saccharothrix sp.]
MNTEDVQSVRHRRLRTLELDHVLTMMVLEESPGDPQALGEEAELRRRIELHRAVLSPPAPEGDEGGTAGSDDTAGEDRAGP